MANPVLFEYVKHSWIQFSDKNVKILGKGTGFIVLTSDDAYCIRIALLDDNYNSSSVLNLESLRLN